MSSWILLLLLLLLDVFQIEMISAFVWLSFCVSHYCWEIILVDMDV